MGDAYRADEQSETPPPETKKCRTCKVIKPITDFHASCKKNYNWQCKLCRKGYDAGHYEENREECIARVSTYQAEHSEERKAYDKANQNSPYRIAWRLNNTDKRRAAIARYFLTPKGKAAKQRVMARRGAQMLGASTTELIDLTELYIRDEAICQLCDTTVLPEEATMDHKQPLSRNGQHTWDNIQLAHMVCNSRKGNKTVEEWTNQRRHHQ